MGNIQEEIDYLILQREVLARLRDELMHSNTNNKEHLLNLVDTAIDYGFYLSDDYQSQRIREEELLKEEENEQ
jgi:hypothetical protein